LVDEPNADAEYIVRKAMKIAGDICVYTNHNVLLEKIEPKTEVASTTEATPVVPPTTDAPAAV